MLVGRSAELIRLRTAYSARHLAMVSGPAGIGKTALVEELAGSCPAVHVGQAIPALAHRPYHPVLHALSLAPQTLAAGPLTDLARSMLAEEDLLVLEDLQWADPGTLEVLLGLVGHCAIVATVQSATGGADAVLRLGAMVGADLVDLAALDLEDSVRMVAHLRPDLYAGEQRRTAAAARGNPLLIELLCDSDDLAGAGLPRSGEQQVVLRAVLARRSEQAIRSLALLGAAPGPLERSLVGAVDELIGSGLVSCGPDGRVEVVHRVFADLATATLADDELRTLNAELADLPELGELARARYSFGAGEFGRSFRLALAAAEGLVSRSEQAAALGLAARAASALAAAGELGADMAAGLDDLKLRAAGALNDVAEYAAACDIIEPFDTFPEALRVPAAIEALRATLALGDRRRAAELLARTRPVIAASREPAAARAEVLQRWLESSADPDETRSAALGDLAAARSGVDRSSAALLVGLALYGRSEGREVDTVTDWFRIAHEEATRSGELGSEFEAARNLILVRTSLGQHEPGRAMARDCIERATREGAESWALEFRTLEQISRVNDRVDHDDAVSWLSHIRTAPVRIETRAGGACALAVFLADRGEFDRSAQVLAPWMDPDRLDAAQAMVKAVILWGAAQRAWIMGDLHETIRHGRRVTAEVPAGYPSLAGTQVVWRWAEYEAGLDISAPDPRGGLVDAASLEAAGISALSSGDPVTAAQRFEEAAESWRPVIWRCAMRCWWATGLALAQADDVDGTKIVLDRLDAEIDRWGSVALRPRVRAVRRLIGEQTPSSGPASGPVTPSERAVLELVARGLRSADIAVRLGVSVSTVNSHVAAATRKLGARNRVDAVKRLGL